MLVFLDSDKIKKITEIAFDAGEIAKDYFNKKNFSISIKQDGSKVTSADLAVSKFINNELKKLSIDLPIVCEEGEMRNFSGDSFWLIDPIDGTNSFIEGKIEFSINIALIINKIPIFGLIYGPLFENGKMAFTNNLKQVIVNNGVKSSLISAKEKKQNKSYLKIITGSGAKDEKISEIVKTIYPEFADNFLVERLSSSLKFIKIIEEKSDIYIHFKETMEWDTAAGQALLESLKFNVKNLIIEPNQIKIGEKISYKKHNFINQPFICF